jgi:hypothetical protein
MTRTIEISRDQGELLVDLLERNYRRGEVQPTGVGADLAVDIRERFGMPPQPEIKVEPKLSLDAFMQKCIALQCVVVPVTLYSEETLSGEFVIGVRYVALRNSDFSVLPPNYFFMLDEFSQGLQSLHETPEAALAAYETGRAG